MPRWRRGWDMFKAIALNMKFCFISVLSLQAPYQPLRAICLPSPSPRGLSASWRMLNAKILFHQNLGAGDVDAALSQPGRARSPTHEFLLGAAALEHSARAEDSRIPWISCQISWKATDCGVGPCSSCPVHPSIAREDGLLEGRSLPLLPLVQPHELQSLSSALSS